MTAHDPAADAWAGRTAPAGRIGAASRAAARGALPKECQSAEDGYFDPAHFDMGTILNATFPVRMSTLYLDMDRNGRPVESIPATVQLLEGVLAGMEQGVGGWEARRRPNAADDSEARSGRGVA